MIIVQKKMDDTPSRGARTTHDPTTWMIIVQKKMDDTPSRGARTTHDPTTWMIIVQKKIDRPYNAPNVKLPGDHAQPDAR